MSHLRPVLLSLVCRWRVALVGVAAMLVLSSTWALARNHRPVTAKLPTPVTRGENVRIAGQVRAAPRHLRAVLQFRKSGRWRSGGSARVKASGRFVLRWKPASPGR